MLFRSLDVGNSGKRNELSISVKSLLDYLHKFNNDLSHIRSHVGMIIQSTTLNTEAKVIAIYGGTSWKKIEGRFLLGSSSSYAVNSTGGEAAHTLSVAEMPSHNHGGATGAMNQNQNHSHTVGLKGSYVNTGSSQQDNFARGSGIDFYGSATNSVNVDHLHSISAQGGGSAHNNMPPYKAVYIWERTA